MPHYRLYVLEPGGRIRHAVDLDCANDEAAVEKASATNPYARMELWRGTKLVKRIEPGTK